MINRIPPKDGQESVWDYPRPPRIEKTDKRIRVIFNGITIVDSVNTYRILETSHPPSYYIPQTDIQMQYLNRTEKRTLCEFKGVASYWTLQVGNKRAENAAWSYDNPDGAYLDAKGYLCFYANRVNACYVNDELVQAQEGDFYGGWITSDIVGPFKGGAGTWGW